MVRLVCNYGSEQTRLGSGLVEVGQTGTGYGSGPAAETVGGGDSADGGKGRNLRKEVAQRI